jgi:hypothetical protein
MLEMKQIADMGPDEASKVFSHVEEKQQIDPQATSVDDDIIKRAIQPQILLATLKRLYNKVTVA